MISSPMPLNGLFYIFITDTLGVLKMNRRYFTFTMLSFISVFAHEPNSGHTAVQFSYLRKLLQS